MSSKEILSKHPWRILDQSEFCQTCKAIESFAIDDTLCNTVGDQKSPNTCRMWVHKKTITLGIQDTKLPFLEEGISFIRENGYDVLVRNSGGLAVVLDTGVLNLSLIIPEEKERISIDEGYNMMWTLIKDLFEDENVEIEAKEIVGSYCPGSYDLSINNKKFAGISQRRIKKGIAVQIYLCVEGSGSERANFIKQFYDIALQNQETKFQFPDVVPETMASLSELLGKTLIINDVKEKLLETFHTYHPEIHVAPLTIEETNLFSFHFERMQERNQRFLVK